MAKKIKFVQFRRKKQGKTDYKKRLRLLLSGKPRLVVRKSLKNIWMQVVEYTPGGDKITVTAHSKELKKLGWNIGCSNLPSAYLTGLLLGKKAAEKKIGGCVLDIGLYPSIKGNRIYAAVKGAIDAGLKVPCSKEVFPSDERIKGISISQFAAKAKQEKDAYKNQFSKSDASGIEKQFQETKQKIEGKN